jgi:chorismate--pyruvate lyase
MPDISSSQFSWKKAEGCSVPDEWKDWLEDPGSLTQILMRKSNNQFEVEVIDERWLTIECAELRKEFGPVAPEQKFWSRKVVLRGRGIPWVMAHTLLPAHSLESPLREVMKLDSKPLGAYLFGHSELVRTGMDVTPFLDECWGRRSLFFLFGKPVMVAEFFLPEILLD